MNLGGQLEAEIALLSCELFTSLIHTRILNCNTSKKYAERGMEQCCYNQWTVAVDERSEHWKDLANTVATPCITMLESYGSPLSDRLAPTQQI